ncbi:CAP domain-containing protein [Halobaculum sp. MBLA0147]|uniref:CAP domain-containing protein n=1 Tax=Halobaculum sp. MBLA0147 TaxID=3079934 RepID=UPI003523964C
MTTTDVEDLDTSNARTVSAGKPESTDSSSGVVTRRRLLGLAGLGAVGVGLDRGVFSIGLPSLPTVSLPTLSSSDSAAASSANATATPTSAATETDTDDGGGGLFGGDSWDASKTAELTHDEINSRRMEEELQPLTWNKRLHQIAQNYAERMVEEGFYSHTDPETGGNFEDRYANAGFECRVPIPDDSDRYAVGSENILKTYWYQEVDTNEGTAMYTTPEELATGIANSWMRSTGHRENILKPYWRSEGIGVAKTEEDTVYVVQNFC